ncbi:MAG: hypothetical protein ACFFAK_18070 [Promethearchaeota archaeon]
MKRQLFKHDVNKIIEACADTLEEKLHFNPIQVLTHFQLFPINFFTNTPKLPKDELENWYYLRDSGTHAAVVFNFETREFRLVEPDKYWDENNLAFFRMSMEEIKQEVRDHEKKIMHIKRTLAYRKLKSVIQWYFTCPLPFVRDLSPHDFILTTLKNHSEQFELESENYEQITSDLFNAYHYDGGPHGRKLDFLMADIHEYRNNEQYYHLGTFRTPEDVMEFFIKYNNKNIYPFYDKGYKIDIRE